jgi:hypothetical protein
VWRHFIDLDTTLPLTTLDLEVPLTELYAETDLEVSSLDVTAS